MAQQPGVAGAPKPKTSSRVSNALKSGVVFGGSAVLTAVNNITPHIAGAVDILVIEQPDGSRKATPFYVRFGKYTALRTGERDVKLYVNDELAPFGMQIGMYGQAYFAEPAKVTEDDDDDDQEALLAGIMSPPSGYSSGAEEHEMNVTRKGRGASRRSTATGQVTATPSAGAPGQAMGPAGARGAGAGGHVSGGAATPGASPGSSPTAELQAPHRPATLQLAPTLSAADRNESFLSARETLATPLGDEMVSSALAAAYYVPTGAAPGFGTPAGNLHGGGHLPAAPDSLASVSVSGWSEQEEEEPGQVDQREGDSSEGASPAQRSDLAAAAAGAAVGVGAPEDAAGGGSSTHGRASMSRGSLSQTHGSLASAPQTLPLDLAAAAALPAPPPCLAPLAPGQVRSQLNHHPGFQQPLHQQLGFPENPPAAAVAAVPPAEPHVALLPAFGCGGGGSEVSMGLGWGSGGVDGCEGAAPAEAPLAAQLPELPPPELQQQQQLAGMCPAQHSHSDVTDGGAPRRGVVQAAVDWAQVLGPQASACSSTTRTPASAANAASTAAIIAAAAGGGLALAGPVPDPAAALLVPRHPPGALDAPHVSSHRSTALTAAGVPYCGALGSGSGSAGATGADSLAGTVTHGSGSYTVVSLLSTSLRGSRGSTGGVAATALELPGVLPGDASFPSGPTASLAWLRAKNHVTLDAAADAQPGLAQVMAQATPAAVHVGRTIRVSLSETPEGGLRLRLHVLPPPAPARAEPFSLPPGTVPPAAAAVASAETPASGGGLKPGLSPLDIASVTSDRGYLGDIKPVHPGSARLHHQHSHHHYHHNGYHPPGGRAHHPHHHPQQPDHPGLHSTSAPLPSSGIQQAAAVAAAAAAAAAATATAAGVSGVSPAALGTTGTGAAGASPGLALSLCGGLLSLATPYPEAAMLFDAHRVAEQTFQTQGPALLAHPDLVVRFANGAIYPWQALSYSLVGLLAFGTWRLAPDTPCWSLTGEGAGAQLGSSAAAAAVGLLAAVAQGISAAAGGDAARDGGISAAAAAALCTSSANTTPKKGSVAVAAGGTAAGGGSWRLWMFGRRENGRTSATGAVSVVGGRSPPLSSPLAERQGSLDLPGAAGSGSHGGHGRALPGGPRPHPHANAPLAQGGAGAGPGGVAERAAAAVAAAGAAGEGLQTSLSGGGGVVAAAAAVATSTRRRSFNEAYNVVTKKSLAPTPEQLAALPLKHGQNTIAYRVGARELKAYVYYLPWRTKIVISDIDGTITKSDVLGHLLPYMGLDWSHPGIAELLTNIRHNNYLIMYLSSRSISQANITRDFINTLVQGEHRMPLGPVIISPHGLLPSLYREMILRRPHEFKIATLQDIRALFPPFWNPFYGGFGNRDTDEISYREVGVQPERIFIINPRGELRQAQAQAADPLPTVASSAAKISRMDSASLSFVSASPSFASALPSFVTAASVTVTTTGAATSGGPLTNAGATSTRDAPEPGTGGAGSGSGSGNGASTAATEDAARNQPAAEPAPSAPDSEVSGAAAADGGRQLWNRTPSGLSRGRSGSTGTAGAPAVLSSLSAVNDLVNEIFPPLRDGELLDPLEVRGLRDAEARGSRSGSGSGGESAHVRPGSGGSGGSSAVSSRRGSGESDVSGKDVKDGALRSELGSGVGAAGSEGAATGGVDQPGGPSEGNSTGGGGGDGSAGGQPAAVAGESGTPGDPAAGLDGDREAATVGPPPPPAGGAAPQAGVVPHAGSPEPACSPRGTGPFAAKGPQTSPAGAAEPMAPCLAASELHPWTAEGTEADAEVVPGQTRPSASGAGLGCCDEDGLQLQQRQR